MHSALHKKVRFGFYVAFIIIIAASIFSYLVAKNLVENANMSSHTIEVSRRLEVITKELKAAEAAVRGYNLTGDSSFLQPGMEERNRIIEDEYRLLRRITADHPAQQRHLDTLKELLDIKYYQLLESQRHRTTNLTAKTAVRQGEISMDRIDKKVGDMTHIEQTILKQRQQNFQFFSNLWVPVLLIVSLFAIFLGVYSYVVLNKEFRLQLHIEARMRNYQRELQDNIALLNKSNLELEQFAYVASHDLQEPLRKISTFSDRLQLKYKEHLPDEAAQLLERMVSAVGRMRVLINDLLQFSRAGRISPETIEPLDLNALMTEVLTDLDVGLQEKQAKVQVDQLPVVEGSHTSLQQLFQNLISNSIKFSHPARPLQINIKSETIKGRDTGFAKENKWDDNFVRITVEDNGIGFEQEYAERIFLIFQRLHGMSEYQGTGIGLAICKKIVDTHHGHITAMGSPGNGATMIVVLPFKQKWDE
ncbi:ATP-binding protein [Chitinophaga horti]|uniref:histidine kinase n=1 Tax=Chitinophaga horti TaxID=2920382 RepID=A0ABY6J313_9BACT|nr:sensor histidine kinase [Chitinophaga horti]UYQ92699.1 ATP-binding protein [Chitinophaga horti]